MESKVEEMMEFISMVSRVNRLTGRVLSALWKVVDLEGRVRETEGWGFKSPQ